MSWPSELLEPVPLRLQRGFRGSIAGHQRTLADRAPEKNPLWNFIYADTGAEQFDWPRSIWSLHSSLSNDRLGHPQQRRRDSRSWNEFREQSTPEGLPPDEPDEQVQRQRFRGRARAAA